MLTGLIRREGGRYSTRRRIPLALVPSYGGRSEIVRALGTSDPAEARRLHADMWRSLTIEFDARAAVLSEQAPPTTQPAPSAKWLSWTPEERAEWQRQKDEYDQAYQALDWANAFDDDETQSPASSDIEQAVRQARRRWEEEAEETRAEMKRASRAKITPDAVALSVVVDKWELEQKPKPRTAKRTRNIVDRFEAVNGKLAVQAVTKQHVLAFKDALIEQGQTPANINVMIPMLGTVLIYAVDKLHLITVNPASKVRVADKRRAKDKRRAFEEAEMRAIFESPVYSQGLRPIAPPKLDRLTLSRSRAACLSSSGASSSSSGAPRSAQRLQSGSTPRSWHTRLTISLIEMKP